MATCWKCKNALRDDGAAFCSVCGAALRPDDPAAARSWHDRIRRVEEQPPPWGLTFLWLLAWPIMPLLYPAMLASAFGKLRRHVAGRVASPALASPRFTASAEGQAIAARLNDAARGLGAWRVLTVVVCYLLIAIALGILFITPANAPHPIRYENAIGELFEGDDAYHYVYIRSAEQYEEFWRTFPVWSYDEVQVRPDWNTDFARRAIAPQLPVWSGHRDTPDNHRPYEYVEEAPTPNNPQTRVYRVSQIQLRWHGTEKAAVAFWIFVGLLALAFLAFGLIFWVRFMRHRKAEALAAAYARGDPALHDRLMAEVRGRNQVTGFLVVPLAIIGWHTVAFPILWAAERDYHDRWERRSGVADAFGGA